MQLDDFKAVAAFLAVAEERSFTRAAKRVGVSRSALSHAVRGLEERIGVRLLSRTTRSVAPTDVCEHVLGRAPLAALRRRMPASSCAAGCVPRWGTSRRYWTTLPNAGSARPDACVSSSR